LLDSAGRLIGVNTAIISPNGGSPGIGFAVPVDTVNSIVPPIIQEGLLQQPSVQATLVSDEIAAYWRRRGSIPEGVPIQSVDPGGAADLADIRGTRVERGRRILGDIITSIEGEKVRSVADIKAALAELKVGQRIELGIVRDGREQVSRLTLAGED
jgi:S1-C subfamily serine protease